MESLVNIGIILAYLMISFAALASIIFGVKKIIQNQNNAKKTIYTAGGLVLILILSYLISSDEILGSYEKYNISAATAKQVGMGLTTFYLLGLGAVGAILYAEISKVFSKK